MGIFIKVLQGSYAYLLVLEILVVTTLFLTFLWMLVRRVKEAGNTMDTVLPMAAPGPEARTFTQENSLAEMNDAQRTLQELKTQVTALDTPEAAPSDELSKLNDELRDKVKYLESKLLEYEILQEEIGTLSTLKAENEDLRQQLVGFENAGRASVVLGASEPSSIGARAVPLEEAKIEPSFQSVSPSSESIVDKVEDLLAPQANAAKETAAAAPESAGIAGLEKLLAQIDELTKTPPQSGK